VLKISTDERHTRDLSRSFVISSSSHPSRCVTDAARNLVTFAQSLGITEFNGMAVPIFALRCRVHRGNPNMRHCAVAALHNIMYTYSMPVKTRYNFMIDETQRDALRRIKERDGIAESEQIRRAIDYWLKRKGELEASGRAARTPRRG
jgi:hypothetical protein